jgi:hypothetical protein
MISIATVLRSGGDYRAEHVRALADMCRRFAPEHRFVCLTDQCFAFAHSWDIDARPLKHDWAGWWAKMELFTLPGPVLFFDLDTVLRRDITPLVELVRDEEFAILRDFYRGRTNRHAMQSSMMWWSGDQSRLTARFAADPRFYLGGDQEWLEQHYDRPATYWQDVCPKAIGSFKASPRTEQERVIIFHGQPRPWQQTEVEYHAAA